MLRNLRHLAVLARRIAWLTLVVGATLHGHAQSRVLDDFATLDGWRVFASDGVRAQLAPAAGESGGALALEFDLSEAYGHAIARKDFDLELPDNFQFSFDLRGEAPVNNFEVKLVDEHDNVWWIKRLSVTFPTEWTPQHLRRRHFTYAWGPQRTPEIRRVKSIEFVVSSASGGKGRIFISNLRFERIDDALAAGAKPAVTSSVAAARAAIEPRTGAVANWTFDRAHDTAWLAVDFGYQRELGGLVLDWAEGLHARRYDVQLSSDGAKWRRVAAIADGNGGRDYLFLPEQQGRWLRLVVPAGDQAAGHRVSLARLEVRGPEFGTDENAFFAALAREQRRGLFPKYLSNEQLYWTVIGSPRHSSEALLSETGALEVDQGGFTIEPFLQVDGELVTWADVQLTQSLEKKYLPIPSVTWTRGALTLTTTAFAASGPAGESRIFVRYRLANAGAPVHGRLYLAMRPFQVNPPWQSLFRPAGWAKVERIAQAADGRIRVDERTVVPLEAPTRFGAAPFAAGEIAEHLSRGELPSAMAAADVQGFASGALEYAFELGTGAERDVHLVVPFGNASVPTASCGPAEATLLYDQAHDATREEWQAKLERFEVHLPAAAQPVIDTLKSNLAYIFINQDGPRIQPGSRNYQRSWIRDGSLTSTALLELGLTDEVREFADWYAKFQFPSGKIPCVVDGLGGDPTDEHDSHGQMIYLIMQVYHYTQDRAWLRTQWPVVARTVRFIQSLRAQRKTAAFRDGPPEKRALYGLVPESISHEGYSAHPMHSYWDNFFVLRGLKDAVAIAEILGERNAATEFAAERDDCAETLYASIALAMRNTGVDYIPGCAELGDFDATSTTIALVPGGETPRLPQPALARTFDHYWERFVARRDGRMEWLDFTPYENRVIGSFVYLGQKERAHAALDYFMANRRPAAWNHWAEVVFRDPATPRMIGDMPHTWCGSDFIRSVRTMFVYEREDDDTLVLAAGVADDWVLDPTGVEVRQLPTWFGNVNYTLRSEIVAGRRMVSARISGELRLPPGGLVLASPLTQPVQTVNGDGHLVSGRNEIRIERLPAELTIQY